MDSDVRERGPVWMQKAIQALILYSVVCFTLQTKPELSDYQRFFEISEVVVVAIFTVEYLTLWAISKNKWKYPFRFGTIVDLAAILPFYLQFGIDLSSLRVVRLMRLFQILKLAKYTRAFDTIVVATKRCGPELAVTGLLAMIVIYASAMGLYYAEHDAQPEQFPSIPASVWLTITTLTTVGYGDIVPVTPLGKVIAAVVMLAGIGMVAVPTGLISSQMTEILRERREGSSLKLMRSVRYREE